MHIDLKKNAQYYNSKESIPCDCEICKKYYSQIKDIYPEVAEYLSSINVDILRPFELVWIENEDKNEITYFGCQYIVFGTCESNFKKRLEMFHLE